MPRKELENLHVPLVSIHDVWVNLWGPYVLLFFFFLDPNEQNLFLTERSSDFLCVCSDRSQFFISFFYWFLTALFFHSRTRPGFSYINMMTRRGGGQDIFSTGYNSNILHPLLHIQMWWQKNSGFASFFVSLGQSLASWQKNASYRNVLLRASF